MAIGWAFSEEGGSRVCDTGMDSQWKCKIKASRVKGLSEGRWPASNRRDQTGLVAVG